MFTYVYQNIIRALLFIFTQAIIHFRFALKFFVFLNSIWKINTIIHFTLQGFLYKHQYIIGSLGLFNARKGWRWTTETTAIKQLLEILEHWGIIVKCIYFHTFWISDWNFKYFKCICIFCIVIPLKYFPIEVRFTCAKIYLNPIKIKINLMLWSCRLTLELEFSFIFIFIWFSDFQILSTKHYHLLIQSLFHRYSFDVIFYLKWCIMSFICIILTFFMKSSGKMSVS